MEHVLARSGELVALAAGPARREPEEHVADRSVGAMSVDPIGENGIRCPQHRLLLGPAVDG